MRNRNSDTRKRHNRQAKRQTDRQNIKTYMQRDNRQTKRHTETDRNNQTQTNRLTQKTKIIPDRDPNNHAERLTDRRRDRHTYRYTKHIHIQTNR